MPNYFVQICFEYKKTCRNYDSSPVVFPVNDSPKSKILVMSLGCYPDKSYCRSILTTVLHDVIFECHKQGVVSDNVLEIAQSRIFGDAELCDMQIPFYEPAAGLMVHEYALWTRYYVQKPGHTATVMAIKSRNAMDILIAENRMPAEFEEWNAIGILYYLGYEIAKSAKAAAESLATTSVVNDTAINAESDSITMMSNGTAEENAYVYIVSYHPARACETEYVSDCMNVGKLTSKEAKGCDTFAKEAFRFHQCENIVKERFLDTSGRGDTSLFLGANIYCKTWSDMETAIQIKCHHAIDHTNQWIDEIKGYRKIRSDNPGVDAETLTWWNEDGTKNLVKEALLPNSWEGIPLCLGYVLEKADEIRNLRLSTDKAGQEGGTATGQQVCQTDMVSLEIPPAKPKTGKKQQRGVNERLHKLFAKDPNNKYLTAKQLAAKLNCVASAVTQTAAWKAAMKSRKAEKTETAKRLLTDGVHIHGD